MKSISEKALMARINRVLAHEGQVLRKLRGERWYTSLGYYFTVDRNLNAVLETHVDLEDLARHIGVLSDSESLLEA